MITNKSIDMVRLSHVLPDWTRMIWSSDAARAAWERKISDAANAWSEVEERSVEFGARKSALIFVPLSMLAEKTRYYASQGLVLLPLTLSNSDGSYSSTSKAYDPSKPTQIRAALTVPTLIADWARAWEKNDNVKIGELLGFPPCCVKFFQKFWVEEKFVDTTWPMYQNSESDGFDASNILLRWLGVRFVGHLPCSMNCQDSNHAAKEFMELFDKLGLGEQRKDIENLLRMPMEWSAKHGIAEIKTPLFKISARTDATAGMYVVQRNGSFYPDEGASGTKFPYLNQQRNLLSLSRSQKEAKQAVDVTLEWTDNGFSSQDAMTRAHDELLLASDRMIDEVRAESVIDFGCGNGLLLDRMVDRHPSVRLFAGVEKDFDKARRAQFRNTSFMIHNADIFDTDKYLTQPFDVGIISLNRISEAGFTVETWQTLADVCKSVIVYSYDSPDVVLHQVQPGLIGLPKNVTVSGDRIKVINLENV
jgi:hypothetical protein